MTTPLEDLQVLKDFYDKVLPLEIAFEDARQTKDTDPQGWQDAVQAFEEERTHWRLVGEYARVVGVAPTDGAGSGDTTIGVPVASVDSVSPSAVPTVPAIPLEAS